MSENIEIIRHSLAHVMAAAVQKLWPDAKFGGGPAIENGFYYDFDMDHRITEADFAAIEKETKELIKSAGRFEHKDVSLAEAREIFKDQPYKLEWVNEKSGELKVESGDKSSELSIYKFRDFIDLCKGPHVESSKDLPRDSFKIRSVAGAYWKGDSANKMLQRIYVDVFATKEELDAYLYMMEQAALRDHRKIGPALELINFDPRSPGIPYWLPKGYVVYKELYNFWATYLESKDYQEFRAPMMNRKELYETSGHWQHYREDMWVIEEDENNTYALKPMNCPSSIVMYQTKMRSHHDLPLRLAAIDNIYRHESTGALNGLFRTFEFNQDDAHIFITPEQIEDEIDRLFEMVKDFYGLFGLDYKLNLSTRPDHFLGEKETWDKAEKILEDILIKRFGKGNFGIKDKDGAFYGPKIDIHMSDVLGREWQMGTIQLDFQLASRFGATYTDRDGSKKTPILIHRVIYGSLGRFIGILIENFAGKFPLWLAPVHAVVIPISEQYAEYADKVYDILINADVRTATRGLRIEKKYDSDSMQKRIRDAQLQHVPYMIIVGEKEAESGTISVRTRDGNQENGISLSDFIERMKEKIKTKSLEI